jgi:hypothetical protein
MENSNLNGMLTRKERVLAQETETRRTLESSLSALQSEKCVLEAAVVATQKRVEDLDTSLAQEISRREKSDLEYSTLTSLVNAASERSRQDLQALRLALQNLKSGRKEDARTLQLMAAEVDRLTSMYARDKDARTEIETERSKVAERHREHMLRGIKLLRKELEGQLVTNEEHLATTAEVLMELRVVNNKIRAVEGT